MCVCLGPWCGGSRSAAQGNSAAAQGLFGELVLDLSIGLCRRRRGGGLDLSLMEDNALFSYLSRDGLLTMNALFQLHILTH